MPVGFVWLTRMVPMLRCQGGFHQVDLEAEPSCGRERSCCADYLNAQSGALFVAVRKRNDASDSYFPGTATEWNTRISLRDVL